MLDANALKDRNIAVDARFLKKKGIGISRYLVQSLSELIDAGASVTLVLDDPHKCAELSAEFPAAKIIPIPGNRRFLWEQYALLKHLRDARYDAFIAPANYGLPLGYHGPTRLILIVHDVIPLRLPRQHLFNSPVWTVLYLLSIGIAVVKADRIVTVSDSSARDISRLLRRQQISVVYPEIPQPYLCAQEREPTRTNFCKYFVYNGGADPRKNVPMLLRAMALLRDRMPEARLVVLGTGYDSFQGVIKNLKIGDRVHLLGYVSESRKAMLLSEAVGLVYPSSYEGFGMPLIEGMAAGIPVITGTGGSLPEVGGDAVIYVRPLNEQQLALAMVEAAKEIVRSDARIAGPKRLTELALRWQETRLAEVVAAALG